MIKVALTPNEFFGLCRVNGYDRPSALYHYLKLTKQTEVQAPELAMHAEDETAETKEWLREFFGDLPSELMSPDWDT